MDFEAGVYPSRSLKQIILSKMISNCAYKLDKVFCDSLCQHFGRIFHEVMFS
jgi:hypothetical protein